MFFFCGSECGGRSGIYRESEERERGYFSRGKRKRKRKESDV